MKDDFSTFEICKALKIPKERLRQWLKNEFIKPTIPAKGQGTRAVFTRNDVYGVALFNDLINRGLKRSVAARFVDKVFLFDVRTNYAIFRYEETYCAKYDIRERELSMAGSLNVGKINMKNGTLHSGDKAVDIQFNPTEDWDQIILINLRKLKKKVDIALSSFN